LVALLLLLLLLLFLPSTASWPLPVNWWDLFRLLPAALLLSDWQDLPLVPPLLPWLLLTGRPLLLLPTPPLLLGRA
jgi:hypothetical protein